MAVDYWTPTEEGGFWNIELCRVLHDWEIKDLANLYGRVCHFQLRQDVEDHLSWIVSKNRLFTVKLAREARWLNESPPDRVWIDIWKLHLPSKIVFFLWLMLKGHLPTIDLLQKRGLIIPNIYSLSMKDAESLDHIFIKCPFTMEVWERFLMEIGLSWVHPNKVDLMLALWNISDISKRGDTLWRLVCPAVCWLVWLEQNNGVFNDCKDLAYNVYHRAKEVTCFWGLNSFLKEDYSVVSILEGWGRLFIS